jgi:hypothetical protein
VRRLRREVKALREEREILTKPRPGHGVAGSLGGRRRRVSGPSLSSMPSPVSRQQRPPAPATGLTTRGCATRCSARSRRVSRLCSLRPRRIEKWPANISFQW